MQVAAVNQESCVLVPFVKTEETFNLLLHFIGIVHGVRAFVPHYIFCI